MNFLEFMNMTQGSPLGLINNNGALTMGGVDPNTGMLTLSDGQKLSQISPGAILAQPLPSLNAGDEGLTSQFGSSYDGPTLIGDFPERRNQNQMSENTRKKTSLLDRFKNLPAGVLMRSGAAMGEADDLVSGLAASGKVLGNYFDTQTPEAKQARALEMYKQLMDAESKKALAQNRANKVSKTDVETKGMINQLENSLIQFETALKGIEKYPDTVGGSLKNPSNFVYDVFGLDFGALTGTPEAAIRQQLQKLKVDQQLLSAALTKGAISDREMALFGSDQPKFSSAPNIWRNWLSNRTKLIRKTISNLENNIKVPDPARQETFDKAMKEQQNWLNSLEDDMLFEKQLQGAGAGNTSFSDNVNKALESIKTNP